MGLFDFFKKKNSVDKNDNKQLVKTDSSVQNKQANLTHYSNKFDEFSVSQDIKDLLWFSDGKFKNYNPTKQTIKIGNFGEIVFVQKEPSAISLSKNITKVIDVFKVERMGYFPSYDGMTPEQRYVYWTYLQNPYDKRYDVGYAFVLYYGLERYMTFPEKFEEAFNVVLKLRDVFSNNSFQLYSSTALILLCVAYNRIDLLEKFAKSVDKEYERKINAELWLFVLNALDKNINARDIIDYYRDFGFTNNNYIKNYSEIFVNELNAIIVKKYPNGLYIHNFINNPLELKKQQIHIFCNNSLEQKLTMPLILSNENFVNEIYSLFYETHNAVKEKLKENRKNGVETQKTEKVVAEKNEVISIIDYENVNIEGFNPFDLNRIPYREDSGYTNIEKYKIECLNFKKNFYDCNNEEQLKTYVKMGEIFDEFTDYEKKVFKVKFIENKDKKSLYGVSKYATGKLGSERNIKAEEMISIICTLLPECKDNIEKYCEKAIILSGANDYYRAYYYMAIFNNLYSKSATKEELELCAYCGMKTFEYREFAMNWLDDESHVGIIIDHIWISLCNLLKKMKRYDDAIAIAKYASDREEKGLRIYGSNWLDRLEKLESLKTKNQ